MWSFIPDNKPEPGQTGGIEVPFIEDARADFAPYYRSDKSETEARAEVANEIAKLGGAGIVFQSGYFMIGKQKRLGYYIRFRYRGAPALIKVAGLPMKSPTDRKMDQVRVQALLNVRDWLKAAVTSEVFSPGADTLTPYMLVDEVRGVTIQEVMNRYIESGRLPGLPSGLDDDDIVDGEANNG